MNLNMVLPKNETEGLLLSFTKNCETPIKQTHTKPQKTLQFRVTRPRETFSFKRRIPIDGCWMIGLTSSGIYNSFFNTTEEN